MAIVYLAVGSNMGEREENVKRAVALLKEHEDIDVLAVSPLIETEAEEGAGPAPFLNGAIKIKTDLLPLEILSQLKMIERRLGRPKQEGPNPAPRPMDLDILFYDDVVIADGKTLTIPHPRLQDRFFVLKPLSEIAPDFAHPRLKKTVREMLDALPDASHQKLGRA
jgi:2-amino-4-hydroxy-6-hydroxymethyldihydropteridine diphosphokinase